MEGPGASLFHGAMSLHMNNSAQERLEEIEQEEDKKRLQTELQYDLENGFEDLIHDNDDSSVNSTTNITHTSRHHDSAGGHHVLPSNVINHLNQNAYETPKQYCGNMQHQEDTPKYGAGDGQNNYYMQGHMNGVNNYEDRLLQINFEKLKSLYETNVKTCQQLDQQLNKCMADQDRDRQNFEKQLLEHGKRKHRILDLEQEVSMLNQRLTTLTQEKDNYKLELCSMNTTLQETQQRLQSMQVQQTYNKDALFREQKDRYENQIESLSEDLRKAKQRLEDNDSEIKRLEKMYREKKRDNDEMLVEKSTTINKLAQELEAAQSQLITGGKTYKQQIKQLGAKLETITTDMLEYKKQAGNYQKESEDWRTAIQNIVREILPDSSYISELSSPAQLAPLKDILANFKVKANNHSILQDELSKRDKKIEQLAKRESELRSQLEDKKATELQLTTKVAVLQSKLSGCDTDTDALVTYRQENSHLESRIRQLENDYKSVCSERDSKNREIKEIEYKLKSLEREKENATFKETEYQKELEKQKISVQKLMIDLVAAKEELERANNRISELQKDFTRKQKEFTDKLNNYIEEERKAVHKELEICTQCEKHLKHIRHLEEKLSECRLYLDTQDSNEKLFEELKSKAAFFNNYILENYQRLQSQKQVASVATNTECFSENQTQESEERSGSVNGVNGVHDDEEDREDTAAAGRSLIMKESEMREHMAEKFSLELKTVEMNCAKRLKEMENEYFANVNKLKMVLERKANEVETLTKFIVTERTKITEILDAKENEVSILIKENNSLQAEYQVMCEKANELKSSLQKAQVKISKIKTEYEKKNLELCNERDMSARSKNEFMQKIKSADVKIAEIEAQYETLKEKYKNVKRTVYTYKEYASKKDEHVENELQRITSHYKEVVNDLQNRITQLVNKRHQTEVADHINKIQTNFNAVMSDAAKPL